MKALIPNAVLRRILSLVVLSFAFSVSMSMAFAQSQSVVHAQQIGCAYHPCDHPCDDGNELGWGTLVWAVVHLEPEIDDTLIGDWYDPVGTTWQKLNVEGVWEPNSGSAPDHKEDVTVGSDGTCSGLAPNIMCHESVVDVVDPDPPLCDSYSGKFFRVENGASTCIDYFTYSFDFQQELDIDGTIYCFKEVVYTPQFTSALKGRKAGECASNNTNMTWSVTQNTPTEDDCLSSEMRTGASKSYIDTTLYIEYTEPGP